MKQEMKLIKLEDILNHILSLQQAAKIWGKDDSTLRKEILKGNEGKFKDTEFKKLGKNYIITRQAMTRVYGEPEKTK